MGKPPAYICVVRHGNRLDAADKRWHLSSPTPYDPPLTYGGWQQSKTLGARIASILRERVLEDAALRTAKSPQGRRKRYRVVIHSSPFLRCVQTSIAISAGLAAANPAIHVQTPRQGESPSPPIGPVHAGPGLPTSPPRTTQHIQKTVLRLDAFLGEWLTPGYYENITPPPSSVMMIASAKAELLRRENYQTRPHINTHVHANSAAGFNLTSSPRSSPLASLPITGGPDENQAPGINDLSSMASALPRRNHTSAGTEPKQGQDRRWTTPDYQDHGIYIAPTPNYAMSSSQQIPPGYVAHARDSCVDVDYQWDSMRSPYDWGDGGQLGEEWTAMHRRFRRGIQRLVDWYARADDPTRMVTKTVKTHSRGPSASDDGPMAGAETAAAEEGQEGEDVDIEAVVILVSHGAGCNALIGAITQQPVLTDVGMASLTMAVRNSDDGRRPDQATLGVGNGSPSSPLLRGWPAHDLPLDECYDMKLFADNEHLRPTPSSSRSSSMTGGAGGAGGYRGRILFHPQAPSAGLFSLGGGDGASRSSSMNAAFGGADRRGAQLMRSDSPGLPGTGSGPGGSGGITVGSGVTCFASTGMLPPLSIGLWSPRPSEPEDEDMDGMTLDFSVEKAISPVATAATVATVASLAETQDSSSTWAGALGGLNGSGRPRQTPPWNANPAHHEAAAAAEGQQMPILRQALEEPPEERVAELRQLGSGTGGLWGAPHPSDEPQSKRDLTASKRRWTVNERY